MEGFTDSAVHHKIDKRPLKSGRGMGRIQLHARHGETLMSDSLFSRKLDEISSEFVLAEPVDLETLSRVRDLLKGLSGDAESGSFPELASLADAAADCFDGENGDVAGYSEEFMDDMGDRISAMQLLARRFEQQAGQEQPESETGDEALSRDNETQADSALPLPEPPPPEDEPAPETPPDEETGESSAPSETGVRHPTALPDHIDEAFFAEFLSLQAPVLQKMETLILELESGSEPQKLGALKRLFHTLKGEAGFLNLNDVQEVCHKTEDLFDNIDPSRCTDLLLSVKDWLAKSIDAYAGKCALPGPPDKLVESLENAEQPGQSDSGLHEKTGPETPAAREPSVPVRTKEAVPSGDSPQGVVRVREAVTVDADRLDRLVDMIGELVITESMVSQSREVRTLASAELGRQITQLDKITRELQEIGLSLRMVPIRATFQKMMRVVRDLCKKTGRKVAFRMKGEDTELDKTVVDKIGDPLLHMVRNAIDHGHGETPGEREAAGKPETGFIEMRAFHKGENIHIEIEDDGRGIDREAIRDKAVRRGLIRPDESLTDRETLNLIFEPGFSTSSAITDVSGRGVGMEVVLRNVEALRGDVEVLSEKGAGTVFSLRIPLTLAIIDGMSVRVGGERYIIPTLSIVSSVRPGREQLSSVLNRGELIRLQGELIPLFRLSNLFSIDSASMDPTRALVVVVEDSGRRTGLMVDELLGQQQIVIKSLGESMQGIPGISGGAVMPDGRVGLILDIGGLVDLAHDRAGAKRVRQARVPRTP